MQNRRGVYCYKFPEKLADLLFCVVSLIQATILEKYNLMMAWCKRDGVGGLVGFLMLYFVIVCLDDGILIFCHSIIGGWLCHNKEFFWYRVLHFTATSIRFKKDPILYAYSHTY